MSKITRGEVVITLDGTEHTLRPSLQAFSHLGSRYENHGVLLGLVFAGNVPAMINVLRQGLGWGDKEAKKLPELIFASGVPTLVEPLGDYVFRLFNGGKSADEVLREQNAGTEAGPAVEAPKKRKGSSAGEAENPLLEAAN